MQPTVESLYRAEEDELKLTLIDGKEGLSRPIKVSRIQKPGLALTGYSEQLHNGRLLTLGGTEIEYLAQVSQEARTLAVHTLIASQPACIVITRGLPCPRELSNVCRAHSIPLFSSTLGSGEFITRVTRFLELQLAPTCSVHGVLVDVLEVGILLLGKSGIGKSEAALDLVSRGHRLVADDVVDLRLRSNQTLVGSSTETLGHNMEIRGLGIINIANLFGITAIRDVKRLHLIVELLEWEKGQLYDRLGVDGSTHEFFGVGLPLVQLPVKPGRNIATLIEVAARNQLLRAVGHHSARNLLTTLNSRLGHTREQIRK